MASRIREHVRSNVVGYLALVVALSGTAYAADKITSKEIKRNAIHSRHIARGQVKSSDIKNRKGVKSADVKDGTLKGKDVRDGSLTGADIDTATLPSSLRLALPPTSWVSAGIPDAEVTYFSGNAQVKQGGGAGSRNVYARVDVPSELAGRSMELKAFEVCYAASATAVLSEIRVKRIVSTGGDLYSDANVITDETDRTDATCRRYVPAQPVVLGPNDFVEPALNVFFSGGTFRVYRAALLLEAV